MADLWGYGEDVLTLWALNQKIPEILEKLGDDAAQKDVVAIYRPSFGRRTSYDPDKPRAEFGEFDAIIGTPSAIYLVETKWSQSTEVHRGKVTLRPEQRRRHKVMRWYLGKYAGGDGAPSPAFLTEDPPSPGVRRPSARSIVARNLRSVCARLKAESRKNVEDVLLWIRTDLQDNAPDCDRFRVVTLRHKSEDGSNFIHLRRATE